MSGACSYYIKDGITRWGQREREGGAEPGGALVVMLWAPLGCVAPRGQAVLGVSPEPLLVCSPAVSCKGWVSRRLWGWCGPVGSVMVHRACGADGPLHAGWAGEGTRSGRTLF